MITEVTTVSEFEEVIAANSLVLADFYADWCEPCKWLDTILMELDEKVAEEVVIVKVNSEQLFELTRVYQVMSVPVLILFKSGIIKFRMNGFLTAPELADKIDMISRETG